ncbi:CPBP family intramembrane glutamic endopeptidase [Limosilactobacillus fastidiosus]|uniref:CPBP family intramembrane metalloprotease n=1 Tax=Limosilactobacillus fastidiosus TaxID=2759855 RepID=A0A7W3U0T5_9LACO|nr:CPBP family intramembrane glutamic endopeptidase [Limosilactobacillus fastidiosus]MBB1063592.1 CPBP family intramembrane metalloprotease [Limosilactobacillus fastidiosus]MBB1086833.1 CPBP family intramembrane metalloprotease [Limosilactobacillus fastidiosus]MCD7084168.1 CPBP family intramembrane metalloprotease [Limosilactobacillus fastidiosus]MCD7085440.1 CPBP family intramembrane metalloprotease [Limosilactobacillus fastidiosus]MCD7114671.1 CPBP family intramembrane metalloprotease [Limos
MSKVFSFVRRVGLMVVLFVCVGLPLTAMRIADRSHQITIKTIILIIISLLLYYFIIMWARQEYHNHNQLPIMGKINLKLIIGGYLVILASEYILGMLDLLIYHQTETANNQSLMAILGGNPLVTVVFVISAVVLTPIAEELVFRGVLMNMFFKSNTFWPKVILSGIVFSAGHLSTNIISFLLYCVMGMTLAYVYWKSGDIRNSMLLHGLNNLVAVLLMLSRILN